MSQSSEDFAPTAIDDEKSGAPFLGYSPGVEECWMELDGSRMRYLRTGSGPALILLHGLLGYSFSWRHTLPALSPFATVYALDMMGAGFSDRPKGIDHSMRGCANRVLRFAERLGISSFDLLGTSHGGGVALMVAAACAREKSGPRLRRLILVAPVNPFSAHGQKLASFFGTPHGAALFRLTLARMKFVFEYSHSRMYADGSRIPSDALRGYMAPLAKPGLFEYALGIVRTWSEDLARLETILPKLAGIPAQLMWGSKDSAVSPSSAKKLAQFFPQSKLVIFPGVGHLPYEECPEKFNRTLIEFLTGQPART